jgi:unsaturated chondroitin disaccharide hydrolase
MKRILISVCIILLLAMITTGCGPGTDDGTADTSSISQTSASDVSESTTEYTEFDESSGTVTTETGDISIADDILLNVIDFSKKQLAYTASIYPFSRFPHSTFTNGDWNPKRDVRIENEQEWIEGFFPGCLWFMYEITGEEQWMEEAEGWTANNIWQQHNTGTADIGFRIVCSFGNGYRLTQNENYKKILINGASSMATRYNPVVKAIRNGDWYRWPKDKNVPADFTLFNDDIMNVELLFAAGQYDHPEYTEMALNHCLTTYRDIVREDGGSYHLVEYNAVSGEIDLKHTYQGQGDETTWSRGQAWLIYGFTMAYRYTEDPRMLDYAKKVAEYWIENIPDDYVPYWDFQAVGIPDANKDSSAAAITASGLLELSTFCSDQFEKDRYYEFAVNTIKSLSSPEYLAQGTDCRAILLHGVGFYTENSEIDVGLIFGDYYYLEALTRYMNLLDKGTIY